MGLVGGGYGDPAWIDEQLTIAHPVDVGVGLITWALEQHPNTLPRLLRRGTSPIWLSFGDPSPYVEPIHHAGSTVIAQVNGVAEAVAAVAAGADVIVAQGSEAGGHGVDRPSLSALLPDVIEAAAPVPVLAAGASARDGNWPSCGVPGPPARRSEPCSTPATRPSTRRPRSSSSSSAPRPTRLDTGPSTSSAAPIGHRPTPVAAS